MITLTTIFGVIHMPVPPPDDSQTITGNCAHGITLFNDCPDCEIIEYWQDRSDLFVND